MGLKPFQLKLELGLRIAILKIYIKLKLKLRLFLGLTLKLICGKINIFGIENFQLFSRKNEKIISSLSLIQT